MSIGKVKIFNNAVDESKLDVTAAKEVQLSGTDGTDKYIIKDGDGTPIFVVASDGTIKTKKGVQRI